jgi:hypothetical protein
VGVKATIDEAGFLLPPNDYFQSASKSILTLSQLWNLPFAVLCGEPAAGKSTIIELFCRSLSEDSGQAERLLLIDFRTILDATGFREHFDRSDKWQTWRSSDYALHIVIDGVDEGIYKIGEFLSQIIHVLKQLDSEVRQRLHLKLVCRTLEWTQFQDKEAEIVQLLPEVAENPERRPRYFLCPLTREAVRAAATHYGIDPDEFLSAIFKMELTELAAYPFTLRMLLDEFQSGDIESQTRGALYKKYANRLCKDGYQRLRITLRLPHYEAIVSPERLFYATEVLAAIMLTTGRDTVDLRTDGQSQGTSIGIGEISDVIDRMGWEERARLTASDLHFALGTSVFTDRGEHLFGFVNRTMAECLAADRLSKVELRQLRPLFFQVDANGEHVVPQLAQTASWLCKDHPDFFRAVLECDAEILLRTEVGPISNPHRERIVRSLINKAKLERINTASNLHFENLNYPGLAEELWLTFEDPASADDIRIFVLRIAEACRLGELSERLFELVKNPGTNFLLIPYVVDALISIHRKSPRILLDLLGPEILMRDEDCRIRGQALSALVPDTLAVEKAFDLLIPPPEGHTNAYSMFLNYRLPLLISKSSVKKSIEFLASMDSWAHSLSPFRELGKHSFAIALSNLDDPEIAEMAACEWLRVVEHSYGWQIDSHSEIANRIKWSAETRHNLAVVVIGKLSGDNFDPWHFWDRSVFPLVLEEDLEWLLRFTINCPDDQFALVGTILRIGLQNYGPKFFAENSELVMEFYKEEPKIQEVLKFDLGPWDLCAPWVQNVKAEHLKQTLYRARLQEKRQLNPPLAVAVTEALDRLRYDSSIWVRLAELLEFDEDWKRAKSTQGDIPPGWLTLNDSQKIVARCGAREFLIENKPSITEPGQRTNFSNAGFVAAALLVDTLDSDEELATAFREKWTRTVVQHWSSHGFQLRGALLKISYRLAPEQTLELMRENILHQGTTTQGIVSVVQGVEEISDACVPAMIWECVTTHELLPNAIRDLVKFLTDHKWEWFFPFLESVLNHDQFLETKKRATILGTVFRSRPVESWNLIWPIIESDYELAESILFEISYGHYNGKGDVSEASETRLIALYRKVTEHYPLNEDPPFRSGFQAPISRRTVAEFRENIPRILAARDSHSAIEALSLLASEFKEARPQCRWLWRQSIERMRMKAWQRPRVSDVTRHLLDPRARFVQTSLDLLEVVAESLERLQRRIVDTANPLVDDFWFIGRSGENPDHNYGPHDEEHVARRIAAWLQDDLQSWHPAVINREVVPRWRQRTDITVEAPLRVGLEVLTPKVIIELKGNWHSGIRTACRTQLVEKYLRSQFGSAGIYLVAWFGPGLLSEKPNRRTNALKSQDFLSAQAEIKRLASTQSDGFSVRGITLDCSIR